jgi:hypothetical protein
VTPGDTDDRSPSDPAEDWEDEPIAELRDLELDPRSDLPLRVRRGIERRFFARDLLTLSWTGITQAVMEWLSMLFTGLSSERKQKEEQ